MFFIANCCSPPAAGSNGTQTPTPTPTDVPFSYAITNVNGINVSPPGYVLSSPQTITIGTPASFVTFAFNADDLAMLVPVGASAPVLSFASGTISATVPPGLVLAANQGDGNSQLDVTDGTHSAVVPVGTPLSTGTTMAAAGFTVATNGQPVAVAKLAALGLLSGGVLSFRVLLIADGNGGIAMSDLAVS